MKYFQCVVREIKVWEMGLILTFRHWADVLCRHIAWRILEFLLRLYDITGVISRNHEQFSRMMSCESQRRDGSWLPKAHSPVNFLYCAAVGDDWSSKMCLTTGGLGLDSVVQKLPYRQYISIFWSALKEKRVWVLWMCVWCYRADMLPNRWANKQEWVFDVFSL